MCLIKGTNGVTCCALKVLLNRRLIHAAQDHELLDFLNLLQLGRQMLVRCLELEVGLKVHPGLLLKDMSCDQAIHVDSLSLLLLTALAHDRLLVVLLEVFEFELAKLAEGPIVKCDSHFVRVLASILLYIRC